MIAAWLLAAACSGKGGSVEVRSSADVAAHEGQEVEVFGVVERPEMRLGPGNAWKATGLRLEDGTLLWVDYGKEPPAGWVEGQQVVVRAKVWTKAPPTAKSAATGPHLSDWERPRAP
jgi:hypothetical protein